MNTEVRATPHAMVRLDAGWGQTEITAVGVEIDHQVARLLEVITGRAPAVLLEDAAARA